MKKLLALVLCTGILFTSAACGASKVNDKALDTLETSITKFADLKSSDYSISADITQGEEKVNLKLHGSFNASTAKPEMSMAIDMASQGQSIDNFLELYLKENNVYISILMAGKQMMPLDELTKGAAIPKISFDKDTFKINKEDLKKFLKKASIDGDKLTLELDVAKLNTEVKKASANAGAASKAAESTTFKKFNLDITLKDGFIKEAKINMDYSTLADGKSEDASGELVFALDKINAVDTVKFPDLSEYKAAK